MRYATSLAKVALVLALPLILAHCASLLPAVAAQDAFNAAIYLRTLPDIQADRILSR